MKDAYFSYQNTHIQNQSTKFVNPVEFRCITFKFITPIKAMNSKA